jgi:hypothetical protein
MIQPSSSRFQCRGVRSYWARKGRRLAIILSRLGREKNYAALRVVPT